MNYNSQQAAEPPWACAYLLLDSSPVWRPNQRFGCCFSSLSAGKCVRDRGNFESWMLQNPVLGSFLLRAVWGNGVRLLFPAPSLGTWCWYRGSGKPLLGAGARPLRYTGILTWAQPQILGGLVFLCGGCVESAPCWEELLFRDDVFVSWCPSIFPRVGSLRSGKESQSLGEIECLPVFRCCWIRGTE